MSRLKAFDMKQEPEVGTKEYKVDQIFDMLWSFIDSKDFQRMDALQKKAEMFEAIRVELAFPGFSQICYSPIVQEWLPKLKEGRLNFDG
jgi:hypothetical protein